MAGRRIISWLLARREILHGVYPERLDLRTSSEPQSNSSSTGLADGLRMTLGSFRMDTSLALRTFFLFCFFLGKYR